MNNNYSPIYPSNFSSRNVQQYIPNEQSYIENILRLNKGKKVCAYGSFPYTDEWKNKTFDGIIEECGKDHLILSNPTTGKWYMLFIKYLDFIEFDEEINTLKEFYSSTN